MNRNEGGRVFSVGQTSQWGLKRVLVIVSRVSDVITIGLLLLLLSEVLLMIVARSIFNIGLAWLDDLARYLQIWMVYAAAVSITMRGDHISMDAVYLRMTPGLRLWVRRLIGLVCLVTCTIVGYHAIIQAISVAAFGEVSASGALPAVLGYASLPFGFLLMIAASLYYLLYYAKNDDLNS